MLEKKVILATRNKGKVVELSRLLEPYNVEVVGLEAFPHMPEVEEDGLTFEENALKKARETSEFTGLVAIADDSGLEVDYLDKAPGVYSARYSETPETPATDESNIDKLMVNLKGVPEEKRIARFKSSMAACAPCGKHIVVMGSWEGQIAFERKGSNGFGYDPVFLDPTLGKTAAELSLEEKNKVSHRAKASRELLDRWEEFWACLEE